MKKKMNSNPMAGTTAGAAKGISLTVKILIAVLAAFVVFDVAVVGCVLAKRKEQNANQNDHVEVFEDNDAHMLPDDQTAVGEENPQLEEETVAFSYTVTDQAGNPVGAHSLEIYCEDTGAAEVQEFPNGTVALFLKPGGYTFTVHAENCEANSFSYTVSRNADNHFGQVQLAAKKLMDLETFEKLSENATGIHGDFVNDDSAEFEQAMWDAIYWSADNGVIETHWNSALYRYSYPIADAEQYCLETFGRVPSNLWSSCPDYPFMSNDGTYLTQDILPTDSGQNYKIYRVEHTDDDRLLFYRTTDTYNSSGEHRDNASFSMYLLERNPQSELGWVFVAGKSFAGNKFALSREEMDFSTGVYSVTAEADWREIFGE